MNRGEFLRELLKSVKKGRVHKLLKLIFIVLFVYISVHIGSEVFRFYLYKKEVTKFEVKDLNVDLGKVTTISFSSLRYEDRTRSVLLENATVNVDVLKSILKFRPFIRFIKFDSISVSLKKKEELYRRYFPEISRLPLGLRFCCFDFKNFTFESDRLRVRFKRFYLGKSSLGLKGLKGTWNGKPFAVSDVIGSVENGFIRTEPFSLMYEKLIFDGSLRFNRDFSSASVKGNFSFGKFSGRLHFSKSKRSLSSKGYIFYGKEVFDFSAHGRIKRKLFIEKAFLRKDKSFLEVSGSLDKFSLNLSGKINVNNFKLTEPTPISIKNLSGDFRLFGPLRNPSVDIKVDSSKLKIFNVPADYFSLKGKILNLKVLKADFLAKLNGDVEGNVVLNLLKGSGNVDLKCKSFDVKSLILTRGYRKHVSWIPELILSGKSNIILRNWKFWGLKSDFKVDRFFFKGYEAAGKLNLKTAARKILFFKAVLKGKSGSVFSQGAINIDGLRIVSYAKAKAFEISCLSFLEKAGLGGVAEGDGKLWGSLKNPSGLFNFSSESFYFQDEWIGVAESSAKLENYRLSFFGKTEDEKVVLENLDLLIRPKLSLGLSLDVQKVSSEKVINILRNLKVKFPVILKGDLSGSVEVEIPDLKKIRKGLKVSVSVQDYSGSLFVNSISSNVSKVSGDVIYDAGLRFSLTGDVNSAFLRGLRVENGKFLASFESNNLDLKVTDLELSGFKRSDGELLLDIYFDSSKLKGDFYLDAFKDTEFFNVSFGVKGSLNGTLSEFAVDISGKGNFDSDYTGKVPFEFSGRLLEPENKGEISLLSNKTNLALLLIGRKVNVKGLVRDFPLTFGKNRVLVGLAVPDLTFETFNFSSLTGSLSIPAFTVYPENLYKLYSVSGAYLRFERGKIKVSDMKLSYVDGWVDLHSVNLSDDNCSVSIDSVVGLKGLLKKINLSNYITSVRGKLRVTGNVQLKKGLHYKLHVSSGGISLRSSYVLGRLSFSSVDLKIQDYRVKSLFVEGIAGDGNFIATGDSERGILISLVDFPFGRSGLWKASLTGNLLFKGNVLSGDLNVSKAKLISLKAGEGKGLKLPFDVDISLNFLEPFIIKTEVWSIEVLPRLRLKTMGNQVIIPGSYYISSGWINYMGKRFDVTYGSGVIENLSTLKGKINLVASSRVLDYYIYMNIRGDMSSPSLFLSSDPPLTREQILNLITTGATPEDIERSSELFPAVQVAYYVTSGFFKPFEKGFTKGLKLETFSVEPYITKYGETVVKLSMSKRFLKRFRVLGYQTTGQRPEYSAGVQMYLVKRFYIETRYNSYYGPETGIGFEFRVK